MDRRSRLAVFASVLLASPFLSAPALAGPPLLCFPYEIGKSASLPWGNDAFEGKKGYDKSKVVSDTLEILKTEKSVLARMETLRRAAIYIGKDREAATELLAKLSWIAMDNEAIGKPSAYAWFDAGVLAATLRQSGGDVGWHAGTAAGADGYAWVRRALELRPDDAAMQFGAALVVFERDPAAYKNHLRKAVAGAAPGSDLAKSIESNWACGHKPVEELKKELGTGDSRSASTGG